MDFKNLTDENVLAYSQAHYTNPDGSIEFKGDYQKINYIVRIFRRGVHTKGQEHLVLNHLTMFFNVFGTAAVRILFVRVQPDLWGVLKTFLVHMRLLPDVIPGIVGRDIVSSEIRTDQPLLEVLSRIKKAHGLEIDASKRM
jgi:hypothetical protein